MAMGKRSLVLAQAVLSASSASKEQVQNYLYTGTLECRPHGAEDEPAPYDADAMKALVASGRLG